MLVGSARPGTVRVTQQLEIERYSHIMHIVSHVEGTLDEGYDVYDVLRAGFPAGTVSGAPKIRAMEIIAEYEPDKRGPYSGAVGYFSYSGNMDTAISLSDDDAERWCCLLSRPGAASSPTPIHRPSTKRPCIRWAR